MMRAIPLLVSTTLVIGLVSSDLSRTDAMQAPPAVKAVDMGDYEPVVPWPLPLPATDLSHDGWTWGSGAGVWAESPNKVWVMQRSETALPAGAEPWICPCL